MSRLLRLCAFLLLPLSLAVEPATQAAWRVHEITQDKRCMFRSISRSLADAENRPLNVHYETKDADVLRKAARFVICSEKRESFEQSKVIEGNMDQYCSDMNSPNFHGGEPELFVLAEELKRPIAVYVPQAAGFRPIIEYGGKYAQARTRIRILYSGDGRYDAIMVNPDPTTVHV
mmetsp:Transcript_86698/g.245848  ORF Transcript_86698/g.245848 Transcript_86698/m.245848 type:complete len:175 (+) Transcript_86698:76-600(+)